VRTVVNRGREKAGYASRAVFQPAGTYIGRGRRYALLRCVCLVTSEDFLVFVKLDQARSVKSDLLDCPACGYEHRAITADEALDSELIDQAEFDFLCSPVTLAGDGSGNDTLRVRRK
jgi:hypothetical protein